MLESWNSDIAEQEMDHMKNIKINSTMETELSLQPTNASIATAQVLREETTEVEKEAMIVQEAGEEALEQVANDSPSINIAYREASLEMSGANQDEVELGDGTNHKKMIPEVCACDTTTGSLEDDVSGNKLLNFQEPSMKESIDANAPLNSINKGKHKKRVVSKFGRRQWGKELTKIRMKLLEHKKLKRNAGLALARQTRQKRLEARKALNNLNKHRMESKLSLNNHIKKLSSHCTPRKADLTEMATIFSEDTHNSTSALENDPVTIVNLATQCDIASKPFSLMKMDKSNIVENTNNSSNIQLEQIEIVEDEDDNEVDEDPWPFATSPFPANSSCSQKSTASPPPSVKSLLSPVSLPAEDTDEPSKMRVGATEKSSQLLTKNNSSIEEYRQILSQIDKENFLDCNPAAAVTENQNNPSLLSPSSPFLNSKNDTAKIKVPSMAHDCSVTFSRGLETPNSPDRSKGEHLQQAKMHSRSAEFERTNSLADSMWKDMFNSDVMPLDFDEDTPTQRLPGSQKLSAVFQTKLALERCDKEALSPGYVNTPCGDSFPEMKTNRLERVTASTLKLCTCKIGSSPVSQPRKKSLSPDFYCQAVETLGSKISNCVARTSDKLERRRAASRLPLMVLCKQHWKKLSHHGCCPVCGLFCTSGTFIDCTSGKGHLHHSACQVKGNDDIYLCPHCGEKSSQVTVHLFNKATTDTQRSSKAIRVQGNEGIARMCIRLVSRPPTSSGETSSNAGYDNKLFEVSKSTLLDGAAKTKLISIMSGLEHLLPAMNEKLESTRIPTVTVYDLSSYIIKNDLSQLALGICEMLNKSKSHRLLTLNKELSEQDGKTLLHIAVQSNSLATVHCLVIAGVEVNTADAKGVSPLMLAAKMNQLDIVKYLIGAGALVEWRDIDGMTSLHCAAVAGNKAICDYMLKEAHANIDCADEGGWTPLIWAIDNGHTQVVKLLLNCQAALHKRDSEGNTCIHWGAYSGNTDIIRLLIKRGADIEAINELGDRPLHIAVKQARTDAVILLLSHGADTTVINNLHQTPAECCHGACSENMKSFLAVNNVLRSCRLGNVVTRASRLLHQDIAKGKERVPIPVTNDLDDTNYPTDFIYITDSVCTSPVPINNLINSLARCNCVGDCTKASCSCARSSISCWYESSGILSSEFNFSNPPQLFECNRACGCWTTCSNRVVQQGITSQLELFKTRHRGWGVKARHEIAKGTFVCEYVGELITDSEADERADDSYLFDLDSKDGDTYCIDAKHYGNISRFINHRCEPNLTPVNVFIDHQDVRFPRICFFANTDIDPGTELGFDYGEKFWLVKYKHFLCDCGCKTCKYSEETIADTLFVCQSSDRIQATNLGSPV
ncbi:histone-lysine N-methyltransferase EHMT2-like isoform X2 [Watersipora subatra]|uniref:histone-lysine N-methyltransferase EHMT2-like isoform X2 n=1 Tax=Watersipora subatra TaxID=2589382 RepID=UPI00355BF2CA